MRTTFRIINGKAQDMQGIPDQAVNLVVTSPPYPMIGMWDRVFAGEDARIGKSLAAGRGDEAFGFMHELLDGAWRECDRVLKPGGLVCVNIGDATRRIDGDFKLYSNHSRILKTFLESGYTALPDVLWRKPTNSPNKFLGSGMLPVGAYVTYEHEYILVLRKGVRREFAGSHEKALRRESAFFWEERNVWFSDVWDDVKGAGQELADADARRRSAAFPFEIAYRLVCMFSIKRDVVLDPFCGTGTTLVAALASGRNAVGVEIDPALVKLAREAILGARDFANDYARERLGRHKRFVEARTAGSAPLKYVNRHYGFPVMTAQEQDILIERVSQIAGDEEGIAAEYSTEEALDTIEPSST